MPALVVASHGLRCLNTWSPVDDNVWGGFKKCGAAVGSISLTEALRLKAWTPFPAHSLWSVSLVQDVSSRLPATAAMPVASCHAVPTVMDSTLWDQKPNSSVTCLGPGISSQQEKHKEHRPLRSYNFCSDIITISTEPLELPIRAECFSFHSPHHTGLCCLYQVSVHGYVSSLVYQLQPSLVIFWLLWLKKRVRSEGRNLLRLLFPCLPHLHTCYIQGVLKFIVLEWRLRLRASTWGICSGFCALPAESILYLAGLCILPSDAALSPFDPLAAQRPYLIFLPLSTVAYQPLTPLGYWRLQQTRKRVQNIPDSHTLWSQCSEPRWKD